MGNPTDTDGIIDDDDLIYGSSLSLDDSDGLERVSLIKHKLVALLREYLRLRRRASNCVDGEDVDGDDDDSGVNATSVSLFEFISESNQEESRQETSKQLLDEIKTLYLALEAIEHGDEHIDLDAVDAADVELPHDLIVTGLPGQLFVDAESKREFEALFRQVDDECTFGYLRLFKRCCVRYECAASALLARFELDAISTLKHSFKMSANGDSDGDNQQPQQRIRMFLARPIRPKNTRPFLQAPKSDKMFLISPPSSPPVGWEQQLEDPPVVNLELLSALSKLNPGM